MSRFESVLVVCIDRDNDLGKKANVIGPVIGRQENLNAGAKLALSDPADSDVNAMFAAVKKFDEIRPFFKNTEIATLTGVSKLGFESDKKINEQLDYVLEKFPADAFILVTDGAEDEQLLPLLQARAPVISTEVVIVKQAKEVEGIFYSLKEAISDPEIARIVFLVPGAVILLWGALFFLGLERLFIQSMSIIVGVYLILKGTGLEKTIAETISSLTNSISLQRVSFPFYLSTIFVFILGLYASFLAFTSNPEQGIFSQVATAAEQIINFTAISALAFVAGKSIDAIQLKKAFYIRKYFLSAIATALFWFIADSGRRVLIGEPFAGTEFFAINVFISIIIAFMAYRVSTVLDVQRRVTRLLIGLPVYDKQGKWIGKVEAVSKNKKSIEYNNHKTKEKITVTKEKFVLKKGRILLAN
ncbi:MAG: DUF373 family protein [Candidatus Diapherotrites archaeon]|nr:DUF373 family protein [Candidatus Diapherotrites archaeon]